MDSALTLMARTVIACYVSDHPCGNLRPRILAPLMIGMRLKDVEVLQGRERAHDDKVGRILSSAAVPSARPGLDLFDVQMVTRANGCRVHRSLVLRRHPGMQSEEHDVRQARAALHHVPLLSKGCPDRGDPLHRD